MIRHRCHFSFRAMVEFATRDVALDVNAEEDWVKSAFEDRSKFARPLGEDTWGLLS